MREDRMAPADGEPARRHGTDMSRPWALFGIALVILLANMAVGLSNPWREVWAVWCGVALWAVILVGLCSRNRSVRKALRSVCRWGLILTLVITAVGIIGFFVYSAEMAACAIIGPVYAIQWAVYAELVRRTASKLDPDEKEKPEAS